MSSKDPLPVNCWVRLGEGAGGEIEQWGQQKEMRGFGRTTDHRTEPGRAWVSWDHHLEELQ